MGRIELVMNPDMPALAWASYDADDEVVERGELGTSLVLRREGVVRFECGYEFFRRFREHLDPRRAPVAD